MKVFDADLIHDGVDRVFAAIAEAKAVKSGVDPLDAADVAEGETAVRRLVLSVRCPHCKAATNRPCVRVGSRMDSRGELGRYHPSRVESAHKAMAS